MARKSTSTAANAALVFAESHGFCLQKACLSERLGVEGVRMGEFSACREPGVQVDEVSDSPSYSVSH